VANIRPRGRGKQLDACRQPALKLVGKLRTRPADDAETATTSVFCPFSNVGSLTQIQKAPVPQAKVVQLHSFKGIALLMDNVQPLRTEDVQMVKRGPSSASR
jgi:hypothetical protein